MPPSPLGHVARSGRSARLRRVGHAAARGLHARRLAGLLRVVRRPWGVALAFDLVALHQLEERLERDAPCDRCPLRGRRSGEALRDGLTVNSSSSVGQLVPGHRRADRARREWPHRVDRGHRLVLRVLVVVEEHAVPFLLPPLAGRHRRRRLSTSRARCQRRAPHFGERPARLDAHVDVNAASPTSSGSRVAQVIEHVLTTGATS